MNSEKEYDYYVKYKKYKKMYSDLQKAGKYGCNNPLSTKSCWEKLRVQLSEGKFTDKNKLKDTKFPEYFSFKNIKLDGFDLSGVDLTKITEESFENSSFTNIKGSTDPILPDNYNIYTLNNNKVIIGPNMNLEKLDFSNSSLKKANLSNCNLSDVKLDKTRFNNLQGSAPKSLPSHYEHITAEKKNLIIGPNMNLSSTDLSKFKLSNVNLSNANLHSSLLPRKLSNSNLSKANLSYATVYNSSERARKLLGGRYDHKLFKLMTEYNIDLSESNLSETSKSTLFLSAFKQNANTSPLFSL